MAVVGKAGLLARRDVAATFILTELLAFLAARRIVRPGYTTLQGIISEVLVAERRRLEHLVEGGLDAAALAALQGLLVREDTLSELAAVKQDAKHFGSRMRVMERQKRAPLAPLYRVAKALLPRLDSSQQNVASDASLAHYDTIYDLRRLTPGQTHLYLLCDAWQRLRQLTDTLVDAFGHPMRQLERQTKEESEAAFAPAPASRQQQAPRVGRVLLLYVDETVNDATPFGAVRHRAFAILPRAALLGVGRRLCERPVRQLELRWQAVDRTAARYKKHLRPLAMALDVSAATTGNPWLAALCWRKGVFSRQQRLAQRPLGEIPANTIPERLRPHLLDIDRDGTPTGLRGDRYEFWIYRQLRKRLATGELSLDDSVRHRRFGDELVALDRTAEALRELNSPWLRQPVDATLDSLCAELYRLWLTFDRELRQGKLKHLAYDAERKTLSWRHPRIDREEALRAGFYAGLPARGIADVFRFVNERCRFLAALSPLQPRYAKTIADDDSLMAVILGQAMNHGNLGMAETSDLPYHVLEATHQQHLRLSTRRAANDRVSNFIAGLGIFLLYSFDPAVLYGSVDGQTFAAADPTAKARHSRKSFGPGKGVVASTLLANHVPLETELIGAHEHESHDVFDICYHNTSDLAPTTLTGDRHSVNRANFAILHWFGLKLTPRFTRRQAQPRHLYCGNAVEDDQHCLLQPAGRIDRELIAAEKANLDRVIATLGLKDMSQATLVRKLCALPQHNRTRKAIFAFDKLIRSLHTLSSLRDPRLQRDIHRSQNRIEAYHQLRSALSQVSGSKQRIGRTDLAIAISNQCGRLVATLIIAYNSILLSTLLERYRRDDDRRALALLQKISPVAWQHIPLLGHYTFRGYKHAIDLEALLANVKLGVRYQISDDICPLLSRPRQPALPCRAVLVMSVAARLLRAAQRRALRSCRNAGCRCRTPGIRRCRCTTSGVVLPGATKFKPAALHP